MLPLSKYFHGSILCTIPTQYAPIILIVVDLLQLLLKRETSTCETSTWTLLTRGGVNSNWNLYFSSAAKYCIFCPGIFFYPNKQCIF